jgi:phosphonate transport system permease protein
MIKTALLAAFSYHRQTIVRTLGWGAALAVLAWAWQGVEMQPLRLVRGGTLLRLAGDFLPPDFRDWRNEIRALAVSVQMALWGTVLAVVLAVPLGLTGAATMAPWWLRQPLRGLMEGCRAVNELLFAMLFVLVVGIGPFGGVLALFVHSTGVLANLFAESVEAIDRRPAEGIRAAGANRLEEIVYGVIPQVLPAWIRSSLYCFDSNVRSAMAVGMVGAGGIGAVLREAVRALRFAETTAMMLLVVLAVALLHFASTTLRKRFL